MKVYFKNLDAIRFFTAFIVLLHHAFFFKRNYSPGFQVINNMLNDAGRMGVNLFFVLSGFLISYLLFKEKETTGTVSYKQFYIRRILRIWPIYLAYGSVLTFIAPLVMQKLGIGDPVGLSTMLTNFAFLLFFAVNIQLAFFSQNSGIFEISWSVCIEEQFYLVWPIIINVFRKHLVKVFVVMFIIRMIFRLSNIILPMYFNVTQGDLEYMNYVLIFDKIDLFGGGMLFALLYYNREKYKSFFAKAFTAPVQWVMVLLATMYALSIIKPAGQPKGVLFYTDHLISIVLFGYLILACIIENSVLRLEIPILKTLGKVSYGIYLFHTSVCQLLFIIFSKTVRHPESALIYDLLYPLACTVLTCTIAYFSYEYFEKIFLRKKNKFAVIGTRN